MVTSEDQEPARNLFTNVLDMEPSRSFLTDASIHPYSTTLVKSHSTMHLT